MNHHHVTVNHVATLTGCVVPGHVGQFVPERLEEIAVGFGIALADSDRPSYWRELAEQDTDRWDSYHESAESVLDALNAVTQDGFRWDWVDGEIFLQTNEWFEEQV